IGGLDLPQFITRIRVQGSRACVVDGSSLSVLDVSDPAHPTEAGSLDLVGAIDVALSGQIAYVAAYGSAGLRVVDISDPAHPTERGAYSLPPEQEGLVSAVAVSGNQAYLAGTFGLRIIDVSDAAHPNEIGAFASAGNVQAVAASGAYAY